MTETLDKTIEKQYFDIKFRDNAEYNLFTFCQRWVKIGDFSFYKSSYEESLNRFMFNCENNSWYINGIKGFSENFDDTIVKFKKLIADSGHKRSLFIGSSMGAYGAVAFGTLCQAQRIIGFGTEIITNLSGGYSKDNLFHLDINSDLYNVRNLIYSSGVNIDLFVGEGSPVDIFCAFYLQKYFNVKIHLIKDADHAVINSIRNSNLLRNIVDSGLIGQKIKIPKETYASEEIYQYLCEQNYDFDSDVKKFSWDYIDFYIRNKKDVYIGNYTHLYHFLFKLNCFEEAMVLLERCRIRLGRSQDIDYMEARIFYKQGKYQKVIDIRHLNNLPEFFYTKALSYYRLKDTLNFLKTIEEGVEVANSQGNKSLSHKINQLKNYIKN